MFFLENYNTRHLSFIQAVHRHAARIEDIELVSNQAVDTNFTLWLRQSKQIKAKISFEAI